MPGYRIWFSTSDKKQVFELPVNPQEVTITYPGNPSNYDVEGLGEIIVPRIPKLATMTFESFFPRERLYQAVINSDSWYSPEWYVSFFRRLQKNRLPFELTISRGYDSYDEYASPNKTELGLGITMTDGRVDSTRGRTDYFDTVFSQAVILDFSITDKGGEPGDVYYNMTISEYRDASPKTLSELAEESVNNDGDVEQKRVMVINRPPQSGVICKGRLITVCGKVFEIPDLFDELGVTRGDANQIESMVTRVLPPGIGDAFHNVYVSGVGWVDKANCKLAEDIGTINTVNRLVNRND